MSILAKKRISRLFFALALLITPLAADWDPEYCFSDEDLSVLKDPYFESLKWNMAAHLKGSWCSEEKVHLLMDLICLAKPEVCVEVGAFSGCTVFPVAAALKYLQHGTLIAIDAWSNEQAVENMAPDDPNRRWWSQVNMDQIYQTFLDQLWESDLDSYCYVFRSSSALAAQFIDEIDFLHLDGDYSEKGSVQDVQLYLPKVKSGGYILLSNLFVMVKGKAPKMKSFSMLFDACEMICEIDKDNAILFRKY